MTCQSCHGRSGMGADRGRPDPAPLAGPLLFAPDAQRRRPAYDEGTLARALRDGIDPAGRSLDPLMPRYRLGDGDVAALAAYLRQLGAAPSPGVGPSKPAPRDARRRGRRERGGAGGARRARGLHRRPEPERAVSACVAGTHPASRRRRSASGRSTSGVSAVRPRAGARRSRGCTASAPRSRSSAGSPRDRGSRSTTSARPSRCPASCPTPTCRRPKDGGFYSFYFSRGLRLEAEIIAATLAAERPRRQRRRGG